MEDRGRSTAGARELAGSPNPETLKLAYFDCFSGISGDMTLGALLACGVDPEDLRDDLEQLSLPGWRLDVAETSRNGIGALDVTVSITEEPGHSRHLSDIREILQGAALSERVRGRALAVFQRLAEAEARIHQTTADRIHFHEVGAIDAIIDIVGTCACLERLGVDQVWCSPLPLGRGFVRCMHGMIPLPAPAVLELAAGVPVTGSDVEGELVTPTGAALVTSLAAGFGAIPPMRVVATGYGAGKKQFGERPNLLRVTVGERDEAALESLPEVAVLETNLDDLSPQFYETAMERLFAAGALDVYLTAVQMKKGRPGTLLTVLAPPARREALADVIIDETSTLGIRFTTMRRACLERAWHTVETEYGPVRIKVGWWKGRERTASPEYEDVKAAARGHGVPVRIVHQAALAAYASRHREAPGRP